SAWMVDQDRHMPSPARDRVTVDLRGVGERLRAQAAARRMTTAAFVRRAVVLQLDGAVKPAESLVPAAAGPVAKLTLRVSAAHAVALATRARQADTSQGAYVAGLLDGMPSPPVPPERADAIAALVASTDQLAALSTDINTILRLLRQANAPAAAPLRHRLNDLFTEVRQHLKQAADVFGTVIPAPRRRARLPATGRPTPRR
ncbi:conserved hypothetical protein, partial [sediment metagenome]